MSGRRFGPFLPRRLHHLAGRVGIEDGNAEANDQVGPGGQRGGRDEARQHDGDIGVSVVAGLEERRSRQGPRMGPEAHQQQRANQVDGESAGAGQ